MNLLHAMSPILGMFDWKDPTKGASQIMNQIPEKLAPFYQQYQQAGAQALPQLQGQFSQLAMNPGQRMNEIGQSFQQSPGYDFALRQALNASRNQSAARGMSGSPSSDYEAMETATGLANQEYGNWLDRAMQGYNTGLSGLGGINQMGYGANNEMANAIMSALMNQAGLKYGSTSGQNQHNSDMFGSMMKMALMGGGGMFF